MNPHEGAVLLVHAGRTVSLQFSWRVIAALQTEWGSDYGTRIAAAIDERKVEDLAELVSRAASMPINDVKDWSPPILETVKTISNAWTCAWLGADKAAKAREEGADEANPLMAPSMWSRLLSRVGSVLASAGPNSGASLPMQPASK